MQKNINENMNKNVNVDFDLNKKSKGKEKTFKKKLNGETHKNKMRLKPHFEYYKDENYYFDFFEHYNAVMNEDYEKQRYQGYNEVLKSDASNSVDFENEYVTSYRLEYDINKKPSRFTIPLHKIKYEFEFEKNIIKSI